LILFRLSRSRHRREPAPVLFPSALPLADKSCDLLREPCAQLSISSAPLRPNSRLPGGDAFMRAIDSLGSAPFANAKKKGARKKSEFRSANLVNQRRNARRMPARQLQRGR
jgi:hypothetical protein